jgi:hypothetical protein
MQTLPEFVRESEAEERPVRPAAKASLTGWETVIFQVAEEPESDSATAALAP